MSSEHQVHDLLFALFLSRFVNWSQIFESNLWSLISVSLGEHWWRNAVEVHETLSNWSQSKDNRLVELVMLNDNMCEIDVREFCLDILQYLADSSEFGLDICSSNLEFNLIVWIFELNFVFIYELT